MYSNANILLVYEEIPERTVILLLDATDLAAAKLSFSDIALIHGTLQNATDMGEEKHAIHDKVNVAIFGEWIEETNETKEALWKDKIVVKTDDESLYREGLPPEIDRGTIVIHTGFVL